MSSWWHCCTAVHSLHVRECTYITLSLGTGVMRRGDMTGLHLGGGAGGHSPPLCSLLPPQIFFRLYM